MSHRRPCRRPTGTLKLTWPSLRSGRRRLTPVVGRLPDVTPTHEETTEPVRKERVGDCAGSGHVHEAS